jgi:flagellar hook-basal body complex protein FliE
MANSIQALGSAQQIAQTAAGGSSIGGAGDSTDFLQTLDGMLNQVGTMQTDAQQQVSDLLQSDGQDVHSAMIAVEKADLSFQLMMQVRNKIIQAYQTISQIPF